MTTDEELAAAGDELSALRRCHMLGRTRTRRRAETALLRVEERERASPSLAAEPFVSILTSAGMLWLVVSILPYAGTVLLVCGFTCV